MARRRSGVTASAPPGSLGPIGVAEVQPRPWLAVPTAPGWRLEYRTELASCQRRLRDRYLVAQSRPYRGRYLAAGVGRTGARRPRSGATRPQVGSGTEREVAIAEGITHPLIQTQVMARLVYGPPRSRSSLRTNALPDAIRPAIVECPIPVPLGGGSCPREVIACPG